MKARRSKRESATKNWSSRCHRVTVFTLAPVLSVGRSKNVWSVPIGYKSRSLIFLLAALLKGNSTPDRGTVLGVEEMVSSAFV
jgi:hypothetical protein